MMEAFSISPTARAAFEAATGSTVTVDNSAVLFYIGFAEGLPIWLSIFLVLCGFSMVLRFLRSGGNSV